MRRMFASHADYEEINRLQSYMAALTNQSVHFGLEVPAPETEVLLSELEDKLAEELEGGLFRDELAGNPVRELVNGQDIGLENRWCWTPSI